MSALLVSGLLLLSILGWAWAAYREWCLRELARALAESEARGHLVPVPRRGYGVAGRVAEAVNRLLARITDVRVTAMEAGRELASAQRQLQLQEALEARAREQALLFGLARAATSSLELGAILPHICQRVAKDLGIDEVAILLTEPDDDRLRVAASFGFPDEEAILGLAFSRREGLARRAWEAPDGLLVVDNVREEPGFLHWQGRRRLGEGAMVGIRLDAGGESFGLLDCTRLSAGAFGERDVALLSTVARLVAGAVYNARLYTRTLALATHDELTGLLVRRVFLERLSVEWERAQRFGVMVGVLVIDVDRFKAVNDTYGHLVGDQVLKAIASEIGTQLRVVDVAARYGGEEFVVLLPRTGAAAAFGVGEKLRRAVEGLAPRRVASALEAMPTISVGVAAWEPGAVVEGGAQALIERADQALLGAKAGGRNRVLMG